MPIVRSWGARCWIFNWRCIHHFYSPSEWNQCRFPDISERTKQSFCIAKECQQRQGVLVLSVLKSSVNMDFYVLFHGWHLSPWLLHHLMGQQSNKTSIDGHSHSKQSPLSVLVISMISVHRLPEGHASATIVIHAARELNKQPITVEYPLRILSRADYESTLKIGVHHPHTALQVCYHCIDVLMASMHRRHSRGVSHQLWATKRSRLSPKR